MPGPGSAPTKPPTRIADSVKGTDPVAPVSGQEPRRRTSIALSLSVLERAKVQALRERRSVAELIEVALRQYLDGR